MKDSGVSDLDELYRKAKSARAKLEPEWFLCLSYYTGAQWVAWDGKGLYRPALAPNRITIVDNRIQPCVRTEIAKITKKAPVFTVSPRTSDEEDEQASELGEQMMRYLWKHLSLSELMTKALFWSRICGAGFVKTFWDPSLGDGTDIVVGPKGNPLQDSSGRPLRPGQVDPDQLAGQLGLPPGSVKSQRINQGDIRVEVKSPFQVYADPLADSFSQCEWLIEESILSQESVLRQFKVELEPDATANPGLVESRMGASPVTGGSYKGVKVREYWCKPSSGSPNGRHVVWAKNQKLLEDDAPFDPFPYVMLTGIPVPGRLWPTSVAEQLRGPQTELNKVKSQIAENRNRVGNPTIMASKQAIQDPDKFVASMTRPGGVVFFDDMGSQNPIPTFLQAPPLPQYVVDEIARIEESIQEISGQHEVTSANVPPGVTAASAINLLMEADDTRLGPGIVDYENQLGAVGQKVLKLAAHYMDDTRVVRIGGDNGTWQIFPFRGAMLRDNTHVEVQAGSAFPQSKAARQALMQDLLTFLAQSGNAPHGRQLAEFLKDMEVGGAERLIEQYTIDETQAERENVRMAQGDVMNINLYDNDEAHVDAHQDFQKSPRYTQLPANEQSMFAAHVAAHKQRISQNAMAQQQLAAQAAGQPPPGQVAAQGQMDMQGQAQGQAQDAQGAQLQQAIQAAQAQHQISSGAAQQGQQMADQSANQDQSRRHAEELQQQKLLHAHELHQANLARSAQQAAQQKGQR